MDNTHKGIIAWFARNSVAANLLMIFIIIGGLLTAGTISKQMFPQVEIDWLRFGVSYPGAAPQEVEEGITFCWVKTPVYFDGGFRKFWSNLLFMLRLFLLPHKKLGKPTTIIVSSMPIFPIVNGYLFKKRFQASKLIVESKCEVIPKY